MLICHEGGAECSFICHEGRGMNAHLFVINGGRLNGHLFDLKGGHQYPIVMNSGSVLKTNTKIYFSISSS